MSQSGDTLVLFLLIGVIFYFILRKWFPLSFRVTKQEEPKPITGEVANLLRAEGYEPIQANVRVPLEIRMDEEKWESRLFVDYIAKKEEKFYIVLVSRERKPVKMSGSGLRDHFLPFFLLFAPAGLLYVDRQKRTISEVEFTYTNPLPKSRKFPWGSVVLFFAGMILAWLIRH
jgi:hypothetical protein